MSLYVVVQAASFQSETLVKDVWKDCRRRLCNNGLIASLILTKFLLALYSNRKLESAGKHLDELADNAYLEVHVANTYN